MPPSFKPLRLLERDEPFDDPDWLFELKHDGFRALDGLKVDNRSYSQAEGRRELFDLRRSKQKEEGS